MCIRMPALVLAVLAAACSSGTTATVEDGGGSDAQAASDRASDVLPDVATMDAAAAAADVPDGPDAPAPPDDRPRAGCTANEACAGNPAGTVCDTASGRCVACVASSDCMPGNVCVANLCVAGCTATSRCPAGQACCDGACADTLSDVANCSACGARCVVANATPSCRNGVCAVSACTSPFGDCDHDAANGCETNTLTSTAHCGACGTACAERTHATALCAGGTCTYGCAPGFADCDGDTANGCEVDLRSTPSHCGACTIACAPAHATAACVMSACAVGTCATNFADCDGSAASGCESDTRVDVSNCGGCGRACPVHPNSAPACVASSCVTTCLAGHADCNGSDADGCESETRNDAANCGACRHACGSGSACCDAACVATASDPANCGACGHACGANEACEAGRCLPALGCAAGPRRGFTDVATFPRIAACGAPVAFATAVSNAATTCAAGWHFCTPADLNATTGPAPDFTPAGANGWVLFTDPTTTLWGDYAGASCGGSSPAVANLAGTAACTPSGVFPEGWRLATSTAYWSWSHQTSGGCVAHVVHACIADGGTIPAATGYVLCCGP